MGKRGNTSHICIYTMPLKKNIFADKETYNYSYSTEILRIDWINKLLKSELLFLITCEFYTADL